MLQRQSVVFVAKLRFSPHGGGILGLGGLMISVETVVGLLTQFGV